MGMTITQAQVTDLTLGKSGDDVVLDWTTGTSPYRVVRSDTPIFLSGNRVLADDVATGPATDNDAVTTTESYFYQIVATGDGEENPGLFDLNAPRPVPAITLLSPAIGQPGDMITIDGLNFPTAGSGMIVMFGDLAADVISVTSSQVTVMVPVGAVTDDVVVCVPDSCSNRVPFTVTVGGTFQSISSLAFEPGTGSLWVGDRGSADDVIEIDTSGTVFIRASLGETFISNVSPGDGTGRVYFSNGTVSDFNQGTIRFIDSSDNSDTVHRAAGQGGGVDPVWARGLAAKDTDADVTYFLDGNQHTVRRVPMTGLIDFNWGNTGALLFNDPAGARFDSAGNLYVGSTTAIYKIAPDETVSPVASGFTAVAGIDLSEDTGIPVLLVVDQATGEVFLVDGEDGGKELVGNGFNSPVAAVFSEANGELFYDVAEPTRIVRLPDPRVKFTLRDRTRVLIHKYRTDDTYPSSSQTEDGKITIEATVIDKTPVAGVTVYFRLIDPKDKAPYASTGTGDNKGGPGTLSVASGVSDSQGKVQTVLTVTDTFSGDNYQVEASLKAPPNFKKIARTPIMEAWRRAYVEYDRMYKVGEFIDQTSGAGQADPTRVFVPTPATFAMGDMVHVLSGETQDTAEGEMAAIASIGADHVVLNAPLTHTYSYLGPEPPGDANPYSFIAKVVPGGAYDNIGASSADLAVAFDDPFTEWLFVDGGSFLPAWTVIDQVDINPRSFLFFLNRQSPMSPTPRENHVQLVAAGASTVATINGLTGAQDPATNWSWVFKDASAMNCTGCNATQLLSFIIDVTVHELGHQWNVNIPQDLGGHDSENSWNDAGRKCLMNEMRDASLTGTAHFHANLAAPSIDLYCIRGHVDDLNQDSCTWPP